MRRNDEDDENHNAMDGNDDADERIVHVIPEYEQTYGILHDGTYQ